AFPAATFDAVFSRFGVMFFADPVAAFTNLHRALRPGGRLAFVCWRGLPENPWMWVPVGAAAQHVTLPPPPAPGAPGPFAFADGARVRDILGAAGFQTVDVAPLDAEVSIARGASLDEAVAFLLEMGPLGAALRENPGVDLSLVGRAV